MKMAEGRKWQSLWENSYRLNSICGIVNWYKVVLGESGRKGGQNEM